jgi:glycyl-radical enzyme activating protein
MNQKITGTVFDIKKFAIHDGPGIRTTVFLKGCPLKCLWCHNPESQAATPEISLMPEKCISCGWCFEACPNHCHSILEDNRIYDRENCIRCGKCAEKCYAGAVEVIGKEMTVDEAIEEVLKDKPFYDNSGGGMTISGGEPMSQPQFTAALLAEAKKHDLHTCLDTCGFASFANYEKVLKHVDLFLFDLKETDPERHFEYTGVPLAPILENLKKIDSAGGTIILRCPIIPNLNAREEHVQGIAKVAENLNNLQEINLMLYHPLGESKLKRLGLEPKLNLKEFADRDQCEKLRLILESKCKVPVTMG